MTKKSLFLIFVATILFLLLIPLPVFAASTVGTSTDVMATRLTYQRKTFYANGRFWGFYFDGTNMVFRTSSDGVFWTGATVVRAITTGNGWFFSIWFDGTYVHYVCFGGSTGDPLYYRRGTPNSDGTITWLAEQTAVAGTSGVDLKPPSICVDSSGYPWIAYFRNAGVGNRFPYVTKSSANDGTWTTASGFPYQLSSTSDLNWRAAVIPLTSQKVISFYSKGATVINAKSWTGSAWNAEASTSAGYTTQDAGFYSAVNQGDDARLVWLTAEYYDIVFSEYTYSSNSFSSPIVVKSAVASDAPPVISKDDSANLYVFWAWSSATEGHSHIYYRKRSAWTNTWEDYVEWITDDPMPGCEKLTCSYQTYNYRIGLLYMSSMTSPYNIRFAFLSNTAPTNDQLTLDLTGASYKGTKTLLTGKQDYKFVLKCSDSDGVTDINYAEIRLDYATKNVILRATRGSGDTWTFSEQSDPSNYVTLNTGGSSHSTSGNQKTFNFLVTINWAWDDASETLGVRAYVIDSQSESDQDDYANVFGVENDILAYGMSVSDYRCNPSQTLTFSGYYYYDSTSIYPPDGDYQVKIKLSGVQKGSTDTTLVSGAFSISDVTAESTVASYSYSVEATHMGYTQTFSAVIVDRLEVYGYSVADDRADVGSSVQYRWQLRYDYDNVVFDSSKGSVTIGGSAATWDSGNSRWYRAVTLPSTAQSYAQSVGFTDSTYGLTTITGTTSQSVIADRLELWYVGFDDSRVNVGATVEVRFKARYDYDDVAFDSSKGTLNIEGSAATWDAVNGWWKRSIVQSSSVGSNLYDYNDMTFTDSTYGLTAKTGVASNSVVTDRIRIDSLGTTDARIDIGTQGLWYATASLEYDSHALGSGDSLSLGGYTFTWVAGNSRFEATDTKSSVQSVTINSFTSGNEVTYGITAGNINSKSQAIVWDRFEFVSVAVDDSRVNVGGTFELRYKIRYDYDDVTFDSGKGSISGFTWDAANSWWDKTVTGSSSVTSTNYDETYISITDSTYGLTVKQDVSGVNVITDRIKIIGMGNDDGRRDIGSTGTFWATAVLEYDNHALGSGDSLTISAKAMSWSATNSRFEATDSKSTVQAVPYNTFTSGSEATYGITAGNMNGYSTTIVWDRFEFVSVAADDTRINVGATFELRYVIRYDYDDVTFDSSKGSISGFTWDSGNGWWDKTVTGSSSVASTNYDETYISITDTTYGLTAKQDVAGVNVVTDRIKLTSLSASDTRLDINTNTEIRATAILEYDNHAMGSGDSLTIQGLSLSWDAGDSRFEGLESKSTVQSKAYYTGSGSEATYGITTLNMDGLSVTVVWDKVTVTLTPDSYGPNAGVQVNFTVTGVYAYDSLPVGSWTVNVYRNSTHYATNNFTDLQTSEVTYQYTTENVTENTYGLTAFSSNTVTVSWANLVIEIYQITVTDSRINAGSNAYIYFHNRFSGNQSVCTYGTLYVNGTGYSINSTGWATVSPSFSTVGARVYTVTGVNVGGETDYGQIPPNPQVVWDRIKITGMGNDDGRRNIGTTGTFWATAALEYDGHVVGSADSLTISGKAMTWSAGNSRFEATDSKSTAQAVIYDSFTSGSEVTYGITVGTMDGKNTTIIWDGLKVDSAVVDIAAVKVYVHMKYAYDSLAVDTGIVKLADRQAVTNSTGWAEFDMSSGTDFSWSQTAYGIQDATYGISYKAQNQTLPIARKTRLIESNAEISALSWDGANLNISFAQTGVWTLKVSGPRPVYLLNATYDLGSDYTTYLTLIHDGSKQIMVAWPGWGDFYVRSLSQGVFTDVFWTGQKLTLVLNGPSNSSGALTVYCGDRGVPQTLSGFSATPEYSTTTKILTGQYKFASEITITMDFEKPATGGGGEIPVSAVSLWVSSGFTAQPGGTVDALLNFKWTGLNELTVTDIRFSGALADWFMLGETVPKVLTKPVGETEGVGTIQIRVLVPAEAQLGNYTVPVTVDAEALGSRLTTTGWVTFTLQTPAEAPSNWIMNAMGLVLATVLFLLIAYSYMRRR